MGRTIEHHVAKSATEDLATGNFTTLQIAKKHGITYRSVLRLYEIYLSNSARKNRESVFANGKDEPYSEEYHSFSSPFYSAKNRHLITPIREDWKLFKVDYRIEDIEGVQHFIVPSKMNKDVKISLNRQLLTNFYH